jgi:hypothetical protein
MNEMKANWKGVGNLCVYEIYSGEGAWPFLHHGSLYRGITLVRLVHLPYCLCVQFCWIIV